MSKTVKDFEAYSVGPLVASVCSSLSPEETEKRMNAERPLLDEMRWSISEDESFATGQPNPCACNRLPDTHKHYLMDF